MPERPEPVFSESVARMNLKIGELIKALDVHDLVEVLSGRAPSLLRADDNQNQNQNGSRTPRVPGT